MVRICYLDTFGKDPCGSTKSMEDHFGEESGMKLKEFLLAELNREVERSRRALEQVPVGKYDWKPHEKSMIFGYLANMVATIPMWITMQINQDELDIAPKDGGKFEQKQLDTSAEYVA